MALPSKAEVPRDRGHLRSESVVQMVKNTENLIESQKEFVDSAGERVGKRIRISRDLK